MSDELESFVAGLPERAAAKDLSGLKASYAFVVDGGKAWTIRIDGQALALEDGAAEDVDCTISASDETLTRLLNRELGVTSAYLTGKLKLRGDLGAAMQLSKLLS
jgi:putative sterol carrier protein